MSPSLFSSLLERQQPLIMPSLLKCDFGNLHREFSLLERGGAEALHLDVMDGHFVPNLTYGPVIVQCMRRLTELPLDAHLMITEPERWIDSYADAGCDGITIHLEATGDPRAVLRQIRDRGLPAGLALNPETPVEAALPLLDLCDSVLVMSVQPGFGGQTFQPAAVEKLKVLRREGGATGPALAIDGGIGQATIGMAAAAGATLFVAGSSVFDAADYGSALMELRDLAAAAGVETTP